MKKFGYIALGLFLLNLSGCGSINNALSEKTKTVEYYRIFDIKTQADRYKMAEAASDGLGRNVNDAQENTPIPTSAELPAKPGRFSLSNPFAGSKLAALAAAGGASMKIATCDGAAWTATANREVSSSTLKLTACLFPYTEGYHLDFYATFTKKEGGLLQLSRSAAYAMVGTPEEWTEKTFLDIVRQIKKETGADVSYLEGQPKMEGTPWLDTGEDIQ